MSTPNPSAEFELREALRRDAERVPERVFDAALHHAVLRRIRALPDAGGKRADLRWRFALVGCAVLLLTLVALVGALLRRGSPNRQPDLAAAIASTQQAIANLPPEPAPVLPSWMSPTVALLEDPVPRPTGAHF